MAPHHSRARAGERGQGGAGWWIFASTHVEGGSKPRKAFLSLPTPPPAPPLAHPTTTTLATPTPDQALALLKEQSALLKEQNRATALQLLDNGTLDLASYNATIAALNT
jgi:hypothetical protein